MELKEFVNLNSIPEASPVTTSHATPSEFIPSALARLQDLIDERRDAPATDDFRTYEQHVHSLVTEVERDIIAQGRAPSTSMRRR